MIFKGKEWVEVTLKKYLLTIPIQEGFDGWINGKRVYLIEKKPKKPEGLTQEEINKFLSLLSTIINSLEDDLKMDKSGEEGYITFKDSWNAVHEFTLSFLNKKYNEFERLKT